MNRPSATQSSGGLILNPHGQVLLVQEYGYYWGLPRGHVRKSETLREAAIREIYEEAGLANPRYHCKIGAYTRSTFDENGRPNGKELKHITIFHFSTDELRLSPQDKNITAAKWFGIQEARSHMINAADIEFFDRCIERLQKEGLGLIT